MSGKVIRRKQSLLACEELRGLFLNHTCIAVGLDDKLYIADGTNIRMVDANKIIHTIIGHNRHSSVWKGLPCDYSIPASDVQLQWPTHIAISPIDGTLHFIDDRIVLKLTQDQQIKIVAGTPLYCHGYIKSDTRENVFKNEHFVEGSVVKGQKNKANITPLGMLRSLSFSPFGELYIVESISFRSSVVKVVDFDGLITDFAGQNYYENQPQDLCECSRRNRAKLVYNETREEIVEEAVIDDQSQIKNGSSNSNQSNITQECACANITEEGVLASNVMLKSVTAMTVTPDGIVHILDQETLRVLSFNYYIPTCDTNGEYLFPDPKSGEVYIFNRNGLHIATKDLQTDKFLFQFSYSGTANYGKVAVVKDDLGYKVHFIRDYSGLVKSIETSLDYRVRISMSPTNKLLKFEAKGMPEINLEYNTFNDSLLVSRTGGLGSLKDGSPFIYKYNKLGRLESAILPTGEIIDIRNRIDMHKQHVELNIKMPLDTQMENSNESPYILDVKTNENGYRMYTLTKGSNNNLVTFSNGSFLFNSGLNEVIGFATEQKNPMVELVLSDEPDTVRLYHEFTTMRGTFVNSMLWKHQLIGDNSFDKKTVRKTLSIENSTLLGIDYNFHTRNEIIYNANKYELLRIKYNSEGMPSSLKIGQNPNHVNITYDKYNRIKAWNWGNFSETYTYNLDSLIDHIVTKDNYIYYTYNKLKKIESIQMPENTTFNYTYGENGGLKSVILPSGLSHHISATALIGYIRYEYTSPYHKHPFIQHYSYTGVLLQEFFPADNGRVIYKYLPNGKLSKKVTGDGVIEIIYDDTTGFPIAVEYNEKYYKYRWEYQYCDGLLAEEGVYFVPIMGQSNAKFMYTYDKNFRLSSILGRIGGQIIPSILFEYDQNSGRETEFGPFRVDWWDEKTIVMSDNFATYKKVIDEYFRVSEFQLVITGLDIYRAEYIYDNNSRIIHIKTWKRNFGVASLVAWTNITYDKNGQLTGLWSQETWMYNYTKDMDLLQENYKGKIKEATYDETNRLISFGGNEMKYNSRGYVVENLGGQKITYNVKGQMTRVSKSGQYDVQYFYDHIGRLSSRKDNYGNTTQLFYSNPRKIHQLSHVYSPVDGKLIIFSYDDRDHLITVKDYKTLYYVITDSCGTPLMMFNDYGEVIRDIARSPFGQILYDSNPYIYMPIDFCGGIVDKVTSLIHMPNGKVYDPTIGQWMTPRKDCILQRAYNPYELHPYRFNGNDPINVKRIQHDIRDEKAWLINIGYDVYSLAPQLHPPRSFDPTILMENDNDLGLEQFGILSGYLNELAEKLTIKHLTMLSAVGTNVNPKVNTFVVDNSERFNPVQKVFYPSIYMNSKNKLDKMYPASETDSLFNYGIIISKPENNRVCVNAILRSNLIYKDVITSMFNNTFMLPFTLQLESDKDTFYFVKQDLSKMNDDKEHLDRFGSELNITYNEMSPGHMHHLKQDIRIYRKDVILNMRYGSTFDEEKQLLLQHAKAAAIKKAWKMEYESVSKDIPFIAEWTEREIEELLNLGFVSGYNAEYNVDVHKYPELSDDPYNIQFIRVVAPTKPCAGTTLSMETQGERAIKESGTESTGVLVITAPSNTETSQGSNSVVTKSEYIPITAPIPLTAKVPKKSQSPVMHHVTPTSPILRSVH